MKFLARIWESRALPVSSPLDAGIVERRRPRCREAVGC
jgi:hypothetical protein